MRALFLDIETLPADENDPAVMEALKTLYQKKIAKNDKKEEGVQSFEEYFKNTSFDGSFGRVLCIALAVGDDEVRCYSNHNGDGTFDEKKTLEHFWKVASQCDLFVGHNVMDFDLRFLYQRSAVLGVKPSKDLSFARYRSSPIFDTMREWSKWDMGSKIGLEQLALSLGIPSPKDGIDGSQVYEFYKQGKVDDICEYCKRDVETTRAVYRKMMFLS